MLGHTPPAVARCYELHFALTREAGGGVHPLEQLSHAQLLAMVGMAGKYDLAHLHLRGVAIHSPVLHDQVRLVQLGHTADLRQEEHGASAGGVDVVCHAGSHAGNFTVWEGFYYGFKVLFSFGMLALWD